MPETYFEPEYVPPHLRGRVSNFAYTDENGRPEFLFDDPLNARGGYGESRQRLDLNTYRNTFDPDHQLSNLSSSIKNRYDPPVTRSFREVAHDWIDDKIRRGWRYGTSNQGKALITAGLLSSLVGGGIGAYRGAKDPKGSALKRGLLYALLAGGIGVGATALMQRGHNRREALVKTSSATGEVAAAIAADPTMSPSDRATALKAILDLSPTDLDQLKRLLRTSFGVAAGVIVMRFLGAKGLLPGIAAGILGGVLARATQPKPIYNAFGQLSTANRK